MAACAKNQVAEAHNEKMIGKYKESDLLQKARALFLRVIEKNALYDEEAFCRIPKFDRSEINLGDIVGIGGFSDVHLLRIIHLNDENSYQVTSSNNRRNMVPCDEDEIHPPTLQDREFISTRFMREGNARYVVKQLSPRSRIQPSRFVRGIVDLANEVRFLSILHHPHIIKLRAAATGDSLRWGYFFLLDCLPETLTERLAVWKKKETRKNTIFANLVDFKGKRKNKRFLQRIQVAYDLSTAYEYMHSLGVIYRDVKPDNIGFDVRGDLKIFDFGLAKEISGSDHVENGLYKMSGRTGSLRFMAPEVYSGKPYNLTADVYAFSVLLWQILSLKVPYSKFSAEKFERCVVDEGYRPPIDKNWSEGLKALMQNSWSETIHKRPQMIEVVETLYHEIDNYSGELALDISRRTEKSLAG